MTIYGLIEKVKGVDVEKVIETAFDSTALALADINRERMLDGVKADGSIMPFYSPVSQSKFGYPNEAIKLKATGAFQTAISVTRQGESIITDSTDEKSAMLKERYGEQIFGTGGSYKQQYIEESLQPSFIAEIREATGLK